ncbi:MAG: glycosyltransferase family 2 protein [Bacteroidales bacterium]|nr:glycosyltransferase family 2 protein [Bacteroidales bacterium]MCB9013391.1 glycosyltransferase family 2 protein [Bacteroidales bacterium]
MVKVAVVILNWNGSGFLQRYLPSVVEFSRQKVVKIIVADNGSTDDSIAFLKFSFPEVEIISLEKNYGFAEGYNRALASVEAEYFCLLNSDVEVSRGWLDPLIELLDNNSLVAACMPKIISDERRDLFEYAGAAGGFIDKYGYPFCQGRIFDSLESDYGQYNKARDIFWASGACLFIRGPLYKLAGGLDKDFFAHMEEIDLCWRLKNRGYRIMYEPASVVYHLGGGTLPQGNPRKTYLNFRNNLFLLYKNLPGDILFKTLFIRMFLDGLSSLRFLSKASFGDFFAVLRAHFSFYRSFARYKAFRKEEKKFISRQTHREIYPGSIVKEYFWKKKYRFESLRWKYLNP